MMTTLRALKDPLALCPLSFLVNQLPTPLSELLKGELKNNQTYCHDGHADK